MHFALTFTFAIGLLIQISLAADDYPCIQTLRELLIAAYRNPSISHMISYNMIRRAEDEFNELDYDAKKGLERSSDVRLMLDFVILPANSRLAELRNNEMEQHNFAAQAVQNYITFAPGYIEQKMIAGPVILPEHPAIEKIYKNLNDACDFRAIDFKRAKIECKSLREKFDLLRQLGADENAEDLKGHLNVLNSPVVRFLENYILPFLEPDGTELKLLEILKWVLSKKRTVGPREASSSSSAPVQPELSEFYPHGIAEGSSIKLLFDMASGLVQRSPIPKDFYEADLEFQYALKLREDARATNNMHDAERANNFLHHRGISFLRHQLNPLRHRYNMGHKLGVLLREMLIIENDRSITGEADD